RHFRVGVVLEVRHRAAAVGVPGRPHERGDRAAPGVGDLCHQRRQVERLAAGVEHRPDVADAGAVRQVDAALARSGALAKGGEQLDGDLHAHRVSAADYALFAAREITGLSVGWPAMAPPDSERTTESGIPVRRYYTAAEAPPPAADPGEFPYTRGVRADGYRSRAWTMRQYAGFGSADETNQRFHLLLERGQTGLSVAFDLPTQLGLDSDHELARGEVGRTGVAIDSLEDMERLLDGIPLGDVSTSMTINAPASLLMLLYELVAAGQGVPPERLSGTVQNDILKEYIARGNYIFPARPSMRLTVDTFRY